MTPEEKFNQEVWWILQRLKYLEISSKKGEIINFIIEARPISPPNEPSPRAQESAILKLEEWQAIKILNQKVKYDTYGKDFIYNLKILQPKFDEFYKKYEEKLEKNSPKRKFSTEQGNKTIAQENLDYTDTASRRAWEKKWDALQAIWTNYESSNKPDNLFIPIERLAIKNRTAFEIDGIIGGFQKEGCFKDWHRGTENYEIKDINHNQFAENYKKTELIYTKFAKIYQERVGDKISINNQEEKLEKSNKENYKNNTFLQSIHLITTTLEPSDVIFLVLDRNFNIPTRCAVKNYKGTPAYIKKLYDIAYIADVPNKKVIYDKKLADNINNGLFRKRPIKKFMRTNKFKKPTLVQKSEDKKTLVLKNEIQVETILVKNIPLQYQYLYKDKTK
ncbi:hypothetical protein ACFL23_00150 [Patescibacteria group bacterium]